MLFPCFFFFTEIQFCVLCSIGNVFDSMGKPEKALENFDKSLAIKTKVLGCEHPNTATTQNNIGLVLKSQGKYPEALEMYNKCLKTREKVFGRNHLDVATTKSKYIDHCCLHFFFWHVCVSVQHWWSALCSRPV